VPGRPTPPEGVAVAKACGIDLSTHRSRLLTSGEVNASDLVVVMEPRQRRPLERDFGRNRWGTLVLGDLDPWPITGRAIVDPVDQSEEIFELSYARIERCTRELARILTDSTQ
jgi:protein-tyrosine-phosphatase